MEQNRETRQGIGFRELAPYVRLVQHIAGDDRYRLPPRIIYDYEFKFVLEGRCDYLIDNVRYAVGPGDMVIIQPMVRHSCAVQPNETFRYFAAHFDLIYMGDAYNFSVDDVYLSQDYLHSPSIPDDPELTERPVVFLSDIDFPCVVPTSHPGAYEALLRSMYTTFESGEYGKELRLRGDLLHVLALLVRELSTPAGISIRHPQSERIGQAVQWMREHYRSQLQLGDIAASVHLSPSRFRALFKEATGQSPMEMLVSLRMDKAKELLLHSSLTVGQIASEVGYPDLHYFSRLFKRCEGLSPMQYAQSLRSRFS